MFKSFINVNYECKYVFNLKLILFFFILEVIIIGSSSANDIILSSFFFLYLFLTEELQGQKMLTRRRNLPAPAPDTSQVSVWGILRKAIGKDLSKIALPVILNEPIGILQVS